jgi:hypothetical protein
MSKAKIALLISASAIGAAGVCRLGVNGRIREFPRGQDIAVDAETFEALKNSNEEITLLDLPASDVDADAGKPVVAGNTEGDGTEDGRPDLIDNAAAGNGEPVDPATNEEPKTDGEENGRPDLVDDSQGAGAETDPATAAAIYTGDVPEDLIRWQVADKETGKAAGAAVTKADLLAIAAREGVAVESDDNKASLQAKIAAARAAAA